MTAETTKLIKLILGQDACYVPAGYENIPQFIHDATAAKTPQEYDSACEWLGEGEWSYDEAVAAYGKDAVDSAEPTPVF